MEGKGWGQMEGGQGAVPAPPAGHGHTAQACSMGDAPYNDHTSDPLKALVLLLLHVVVPTPDHTPAFVSASTCVTLNDPLNFTSSHIKVSYIRNELANQLGHRYLQTACTLY